MAIDYNSGLSASHISSDLGHYEAARTPFFVFYVDGISGIKKSTVSFRQATLANDDKLSDKAGDYLKLNVTKSSIPFFSLSTLEYKRGNETVKFAGVPTFDAGSITVDDVVGLDTKEILLAWQALAYDVDTRRGGRMADWVDSDGNQHSGYKKVCHLIEYTQDFEMIRSWTLYGCWVSKVSEEGFDKESDNKRSIEATIEYDYAKMELGNYSDTIL